MSAVEELVEMGFEKERAERAVELTDGRLETAMEWLIAHDGEELPPKSAAEAPAASEAGGEAPTESGEAASSEQAAAMNSYKCNDCNKLFRDMDALMFHATKSGHENFSESSEEIKPLTAEEKKQQTEELRQRIKAHRAKKEEAEKQEAIEKERRRREDGKKMLENREKQKETELRQIAEERRRAKTEDQIARERVLEQIRLDKEARKARELGQAPPQPTAPVHVAPPAPKKDYSKTIIQVRLADGRAVKQEFGVDEPLASVRAWIAVNNQDLSDFARYQLYVPFPRTLFTEDDYPKPLKALGLVPSATIVMTKV